MMKEWKKRMALLITVPALCVTASPVFAATGVVDDVPLLSEAECTSLSEQMEELAGDTDWDIFAISTDDAGGKTSREYADDYFDTYATRENGVVFLIDMDNREITISTAGESIYYLTDERIDEILDDAYAYVSNAQYYDCYIAMLNGVQKYYEQGIASDAYIYDEETGKIIPYRKLTAGEFAFALIVAVAVGALVFSGIHAKYKLKFAKDTMDPHGTGDVKLENSKDRFVNQIVTHRRIPKNPPPSNGGSSGSSGRSTVHTSSAGTMHGGGSRKF